MRRWAVRIFLLITAVIGLIAAVDIYGLRSTQNGYFLNSGLTGKTFVILFFMVIISSLALGMLVLLQDRTRKFTRILDIIENGQWYFALLLFSGFVLIECLQNIIFLGADIPPPHYSDYLDLLISILPLLYFGLIESFVFIILLLVLRPRNNPLLKLFSSIEIPWVIIFSFLSLVYIVFDQSKYGFVPHTNRRLLNLEYGHLVTTRVPLIGEQVFIVLVPVLVIYLLIKYLGKKPFFSQKRNYFEWVLIICIWVAAYLLWCNVPVEANYFTGVSGFPNSTTYPISDAFYFDSESFILINKGEFTARTTHVLYSFFIAVLHFIKGPNFSDIIGIQIGFLALIPVFIYKLTSSLHNKISGVFVALLFILREMNGLRLSNILSGTLVNQMMTESFGVLGAVCFLYLVIEWLKGEQGKKNYSLLAGAVMGVSLLIRAELVAMLLAASAGALIYLWKHKKRWFLGMVQIWAIVGVIIVPWMSRNYFRNGIFSLDKGNFVQKRIGEYVGNLSKLINEDPLPEVEEKEIVTDPELIPYVPELDDIPNHLVSSAWQSILYLPTSHQPLFTFSSLIPNGLDNYQNVGGFFSEKYNERYVRSLPYYWYYWDGEIELRSVFSVSMVLILISLGFWSIWKKEKTIALILPLALVAHISVWSAAGMSGGRFNKPANWITLVFYGIGLIEVAFILMRKFNIIAGNHTSVGDTLLGEDTSQTSQKRTWYVIPVTVMLVILGWAPVASEIILPNRLNNDTFETRMAVLTESSQGVEAEPLHCYVNEIDQTSSTTLYGIALYPRYFEMDEALEDDRGRRLPDSDQQRLEFFIIGDTETWVSLPLDEPMAPFDNNSEVIVLGEYVRNSHEDKDAGYKPYFEAEAIYILSISNSEGKLKKITRGDQSCDLELPILTVVWNRVGTND